MGWRWLLCLTLTQAAARLHWVKAELDITYQVSFKCDSYCDEDTAGKGNVRDAFTDGVEFAGVDTEEHQDAENDVWKDEEKVSNAKEAE